MPSRAGEEVPDRDVEGADGVNDGAVAAEPLRPRIHLVPQAARVVHRLPGHDAGEPLRPLVVNRHRDRRLDDLWRGVALADAGEAVVTMDEDHDIPIAAFEAVEGGLGVLKAQDLHPFDGDGHASNVRRA